MYSPSGRGAAHAIRADRAGPRLGAGRFAGSARPGGGGWPGARAPGAPAPAARPPRTTTVGSRVVLDLVFLVGVLALFALVSAVAAGVETL